MPKYAKSAMTSTGNLGKQNSTEGPLPGEHSLAEENETEKRLFGSLRTGSLRGRKKIRRAKCESGSEASGTRTSSSPDRSRLVPLALDYTWLSRPKPNREPVRRLINVSISIKGTVLQFYRKHQSYPSPPSRVL